MAEPTFGERGELLDGGTDLNIGGLSEYIKDVIYVVLFVQVASLYSEWFLLVLLVIPGFALVMLWVKVIAPWIFEQPPELSEADVKRMQKKERQEARQAKFAR
eukprot:Nk52_evm1s1119 gene=Nk52_evmTU1s1119